MQIFIDDNHAWAPHALDRSVDVAFLLEQSRKKLSQNHLAKRPLWIFDIDSTLFCLADRFQHIFFDYLRFRHPGPVPALYWRIAEGLNPAWHRYGIEPCLAPAFAHWGVADAESVARKLSEQMFPFWYDAFFSERYLERDFAYPEAVNFVREIYNAGIDICYLTGRHAKTMTRGTQESLRALGFPLDSERAFLRMKSNLDESDVGFKARYLRHLGHNYRVLGFMDNEPENVHAQLEVNKDALAVWFHSISSDRIPVLSPSERQHLYVLRSFAK